jgi:nitrite reductase/ring-hydroxylating ferredoxin subunit
VKYDLFKIESFFKNKGGEIIADFVEIARIDELEKGTMKVFSLEGGREIMLARVGDEYYASDNHCPHKVVVFGRVS